MAYGLAEPPVLEESLLESVSEALGKTCEQVEYLTSGAAGHVFRLTMCDGAAAILKTARPDRPALFESEAFGLRHIAATNTVPVPMVLAVTPQFLVLEDLGTPTDAPTDEAWALFGEQVGRMHSVNAANFGHYNPATHAVSRETQPSALKCREGHAAGSLPATDGQNWVDFYQNERILPLFSYLKNPEVLTAEDRAGILRIIEVLGKDVPATEPSLGHGDLWRENVHLGANGTLYLIDPAVDYTHPEADLATSQMYEIFPPAFYDGYRKQRELAEDWTDRLPLYQLKEILYMTGQFAHEPSLTLLRENIVKFAGC